MACGGSDDAPASLDVANANSTLPPLGANAVISASDCTLAKVGGAVPASSIGMPTNGARVVAATWFAATATVPGYCRVDAAISPVNPSAKDINVGIALPASWNHRSDQLGGGGNNGSIPVLTAVGATSGILTPPLSLGFATYGSDSGHLTSDGNAWALSDEAVRNLGYMAMKKTYDVAMIVINRMYGEKPRFKYYTGSSQGGREAVTVAQRYPDDFDGISSNVAIVGFGTLFLSPPLNLIQQNAFSRYVPRVKGVAIVTEIIRQCDKLDGLADGVISNYVGCRDIFDVTRGAPGRDPWLAKRCVGGIDNDPANATATACLTDGQVETLNFFLKPYRYTTPMSNGVEAFGQYLPGPGVASLLASSRYIGQENPGPNLYNGGQGAPFVLGALMQDLSANPLTRYIEGGALDARRRELSEWLDSTNPDLSAFYKKGGKWIMTIGANDTTAAPGEQLNFFQSVINKMSRNVVDAFARFYVVPQGGHSTGGDNYAVDGDGNTIPVSALPSAGQVDQLTLLTDWVEKNVPPPSGVVAANGGRSRPICSYPEYPKYISGDVNLAASFVCTNP